MGPAARLDAGPGPWNGICSHLSLNGMYASSSDNAQSAKLRLTPAGLCLSVAMLCVAAAFIASGQPIGIRWALLVFASAFFNLAIAARPRSRATKRTP